jgi:RNA polymerase sigma factor (sigma-70 family)
MTLPVAPPVVSPQPDDRARGRRARTEAYLQGAAEPLPDRHFGLVRDESDVRSRWDDALATLVMDRFRRTRDATAFDHLADLVGPMLLRRARFRLRCCRVNLDPDEVVQDVLVNVYRYPDRFDGSRPRAFRAWVATILDNVIRRQLRPTRGATASVQIRPNDLLAECPEAAGRGPVARLTDGEACERALVAYRLLLATYLDAYGSLNERERLVLYMVEVRGMRYADLAPQLGIRPEALKMVVFRARRRVYDRIEQRLGSKDAAGGEVAAAA